VSSLRSGTWNSILKRVSQVVDLETTAREHKALTRKRKIRTAEGLLRLALMYGPGQQSLRGAATRAGDAGIAELSDKAVEGRLRKMGDWLEHILQQLLGDLASSPVAGQDGLALSLVDGSLICAPGKGGTWRLHACYDPGRGRFVDLKLTTDKEAERAERTRIEPGRTVIMDRGYARVRDFQAVLCEGSDFITRIGWRAVKMRDHTDTPVDVTAMLPKDDTAYDQDVWVKGIARPLRLVIQRLPAEAAEKARRKRARKANKNGNALDPRTSQAAGYLIVLTSLERARQPAGQIVALYRNRWQVEIGFKRLKTLGGIDKLPAADPALARTWLVAHLIAAVLTDELANEIVGFSPGAGRFSAGA
jgi:hypothetical protein